MDSGNLNDILSQVGSLDEALENLGSLRIPIFAVALLINALGCFFGYKLFKIYIAIGGFCIGGLIGAVIGAVISSDSVALKVICGLIFGVLCAILAYKLYKIGVFLMGFFIGVTLTVGIAAVLTQDDSALGLALLGGIVVGIVIGIIAVIFTKPVIIITSALDYGMYCGTCLAFIIAKTTLSTIFGLVFVVLGIIVQIKTNGGLLESKEIKLQQTPPSQGGAPVG